MRTNLKDFILQLDHFVDKETCNKTLQEINNISYQQHTFYNVGTDKDAPRSGEQELEVSYDNISTKSIIMNRIWHACKSYINELQYPWFTGWAGYSSVRFNKYSENKKMAAHVDHIHSLFEGKRKGIPILSVLGVLNDDYEGGEFIFFDDYKVDFKQGDIVIFPSNFMYPHRVEPVTKGTRYSYISWVW